MTLRTRRLTALAAAVAVAATVGVGASGNVPTTPAVADDVVGEGPVTPRPAGQAEARSDAATRTVTPSPSATGASAQRTAERQAPPVSRRTDRVLDEDLRGPAALRAIDGQVAEVAARNGISEQQLVDTLAEDDTAWVDTGGRVYFHEPMAATVTGPMTGAVDDTNVDTTQTFDLHSRPGATRSIVIDADGADVSGTAWNTRPTKPFPSGRVPGWDSDGMPGSFSRTEHAWIQEVWRQVSEAYAAFDVDVTTASSDDSVWNRSSTTDDTYGTRVVVTSSTTIRNLECSACVGTAFLGTFGQMSANTYQPAWVFADNKTMSPVVAAQTVTHEAGHTFGLSHDGDAASAYHTGSPLWGPIMGSGMQRAISHWSKGEYAGATQQEDDLAKIALKAPLVADDAGDTWQAARALPAAAVSQAAPAAAAYDVDGVISTREDKDVFTLDLSCTTTVTAKATGIGVQSALDLKLDLLDGAGGTLQSSSPDTTMPIATWAVAAAGMDAAVSRQLTPGTYYLSVDGVGDNGDTRAEQAAWSDYGSLGRYRLQATGCPTVGTTPTSSPTPTTTPTPSPTTTPSPSPTEPAAPVPTTPAPVVLTRPGTPTIGTASSGASGGIINATARWNAPTTTGGQALLGYRVKASRLDSYNRVVATYTSARVAPSARSIVYRLPRGRYTFVVLAENGIGASAWSAKSRIVTAR